jgi:hypothetical protein
VYLARNRTVATYCVTDEAKFTANAKHKAGVVATGKEDGAFYQAVSYYSLINYVVPGFYV